ncbi:MAG: hypothetical protein HC913_16175 [Microscillaceae bacterium]|nr:hypothetical protein [Microscillaceae bacterium]
MVWISPQKLRNFITFRSIKSRLVGTVGLFLLLILAIIFTFFLYLRNHYQLDRIQKSLLTLRYQIGEIRQEEKNFLLFDRINPSFFETGQSEYLVQFRKKTQIARSIVSELQKKC